MVTLHNEVETDWLILDTRNPGMMKTGMYTGQYCNAVLALTSHSEHTLLRFKNLFLPKFPSLRRQPRAPGFPAYLHLWPTVYKFTTFSGSIIH